MFTRGILSFLTMSKIFIYIDNYERFKFFSKIAHHAKDLGFDVIAITNRPSIYLLAKLNGLFYNCLLLKDDLDSVLSFNLSCNASVISGRMTETKANKLFNSMVRVLRKNTTDKDFVLIWNGSCPVGDAIRYVKTTMHYKTLFLEISNFECRLFVDPEGVNARSRLYNDKEYINGFLAQQRVDSEWIESYEEYKSSPPPQSKIANKFNLPALFDYVAFSISNKLIIDDERGVLFYLRGKTSRQRKINSATPSINSDSRFIFCPLQVSTDTQLTINSDYDNIGLLKYAKELASALDLEVVAKIHPAENNPDELNRITKFIGSERGLYLSSESTTSLIKNSTVVCVNNSTVALEAMIYQKETHVIGRSYFTWFNDKDIDNYLFCYLLPVDYFTLRGITNSSLIEMLGRAK